MNNKRNTLIGVLLLLVVMTIGYALFSETVTIGGTAKGEGNLSLDFYNPDGTTGFDIKVNGVGSSGTAKIDPSRKTLKVTASFDYPTAYVEIPVKIKNTGDIDLYVSDVNVDGTAVFDYGDGPETEGLIENIGYDSNLFTYEGIKKHDLIKSKSEKNIIIKTKWIEDGWIEECIKSITFDLSISGVQEINDNNTGLPVSPYKYAVGNELCLNGQEDCFNVIKDNGDSVTMLAKYNLNLDGLTQTSPKDGDDVYGVAIAELNSTKKPTDKYGYWTDDNGDLLPEYGTVTLDKYGYYKPPVDVYNKAPNSNSHLLDDNKIVVMVNNYVNKLKGIKKISKNDETSLTGRLIHFSELVELGYPSDAPGSCTNKENATWLTNGQRWWTDSADQFSGLLHVYENGSYGNTYFWFTYDGVRPVITIKKTYL